jgi:hypothetical protein
MPPASRFWIAPTIVMVAGSLAGIAAGAIAFASTSDSVRLEPSLGGWLFLTALAAPVALGVGGLVWLLVRWRRARPSTSVRRRVLVAVAVALGALAATAGGLALDINKTLFAGSPAVESQSPGGRRAYVIPQAFFCGHELWIQEPGAWTIRRVDRVDSKCETTPGIAWDGEQPRFTGVVPGEPIELYFGPH